MWVCALCAVIFADAATLTTKVSPVQKVVELLDELKAKVQGDLAAEETMMEEYSQYCDSGRTSARTPSRAPRAR